LLYYGDLDFNDHIGHSLEFVGGEGTAVSLPHTRQPITAVSDHAQPFRERPFPCRNPVSQSRRFLAVNSSASNGRFTPHAAPLGTAVPRIQ